MSSSSSPYVGALESFYNSVGKTYNRNTCKVHGAGVQGLVDAAGSAIKEGSWVLDLATGTGNVALAAATTVGNTGHVLGIDISDELLEIAVEATRERKLENYVQFVKMDVNHLALPDSYSEKRCFDAVTCGSAIAMFQDPKTVLDAVATQFLKPGGTFVADMYGPHMPAKLFLDVAVPRGFNPPMDPSWIGGTEISFRNFYKDSPFDLKELIISDAPSEARWDASTTEATEKLWESTVVDSTWVSFGLENMEPDSIAAIKKAWMEEVKKQKGSDGFLSVKMKRYLGVAILKSG